MIEIGDIVRNTCYGGVTNLNYLSDRAAEMNELGIVEFICNNDIGMRACSDGKKLCRINLYLKVVEKENAINNNYLVF